MKFFTINPATGERIREYEACSKAKVAESVRKAREALGKWRLSSVEERSELLKEAAKVVRKNRREIGKIITEEMGKPVKHAVREAEKSAERLEFYANASSEFLRPEEVKTDAKKSMIVFEPLGVIGYITPWNAPVSQTAKTASSLMAGNTVIVKPSSITTGAVLKFQEAVNSVLPDGVFNVITGTGKTGEYLVGSDIDGISFTGSTETGSKVAEIAGKTIKKVAMELGGSDPFIVLEDADIQKAAEGAVKGRFSNCGQNCNAAKRFIVLEAVAEDFKDAFVKRAAKIKVGDPFDKTTEMGPLVREEARRKIEEQVRDAVERGAETLLGGERIRGRGFFYEPTIIADAKPDMRIMKEEVFGPVAPVMTVKNTEEAIKTANNTQYGLSASIWTSGEAWDIINKIEAGMVFVNSPSHSDHLLPFGGIKKSGTGRDHSRHGMLEFVNIKAVKVY